jgi:hypothetical protein
LHDSELLVCEKHYYDCGHYIYLEYIIDCNVKSRGNPVPEQTNKISDAIFHLDRVSMNVTLLKRHSPENDFEIITLNDRLGPK